MAELGRPSAEGEGKSGGLTQGIYLARVISHLDPTFMGSLEVTLLKDQGNDPGDDSQLHIVKYAPPFFGYTGFEYMGKNDGTSSTIDGFNDTQKSYGMWFVPPDVGVNVLVLFVDGDPGQGYWFACVPGRYIPHAACGLKLLHETGLLEHVLPEIAATVTCEQSPDFHPEGSVFNHLCLMLQQLPPDAPPSLPWAVLLHDVAKPLTASRDEATGSIHFYEHEKIGATMAEEILERLRFPRKQIQEIADAVLHHMQFKDALKMRKSTLRRMMLRETFPLELQLHRLDCLGSHRRMGAYDFLVAQSAELASQPEIRPPLLTGVDLIALGMKPGKEMGALLNEIRDKQLQDELKTADEARDWVKSRR